MIAFEGRSPHGRDSSFVNSARKTIVMVDDETVYVDFLAKMLAEYFDHPVLSFSRANEALAALPTLDVAIVVTDYWMPRMNGFEFIQAAGPIMPGVPFIIISGHAMHLAEQDLSRLVSLRAILPKPFSWRKLAETIEVHAPQLQRASGPTELKSRAV
jgi:two-component SAPR family response regulator